MSNQSKKIFLALSIIVPFLLYCVYYYGMMIKNAPYKFSEFVSIEVKSGTDQRIDRTFNSKTQVYDYTNSSGQQIHSRSVLSKDDLLYLHRKAAELGFWDWPEKMLGDTARNSPHYYLTFNYERKSKSIEINGSYYGNQKLKDAALQLIKMVDESIDKAEVVK